MTKRTALAAVLVAGVVAAPAGAANPPMPAPSQFSARVDNPWFPLKPGTVYAYRGSDAGKKTRDVLTVTQRTRRIEGVPCVVIDDRLYSEGKLRERTTDWYSQDRAGNVWYFGEDTAELDARGHVTSTSGTWRAGVNGAKAGVFMFAHPKVGQSAQQELFKGQAEDHFEVLSRDEAVRVPFVSSEHALLTKEWTPLEPGVLDHKVYVRGIGTVLEQTVKGGSELLRLVSMR